MQYLLLIYVADEKSLGPDAPAEPPMEAWMAYTRALIEAGALVGGNALQGPETATTVRVEAGRRMIQDGPYADTKEQLGGYYLIDVPDLDAALAWAARMPSMGRGPVEVRPIMPTPMPE